MTNSQIFWITSYIIAALYNLLFYFFIFKKNKYIDIDTDADVNLINKILGIILPGVNLVLSVFFAYYHIKMLQDSSKREQIFKKSLGANQNFVDNTPKEVLDKLMEQFDNDEIPTLDLKNESDCEHEFITKFGVSECQNCGMEEFPDEFDDIMAELYPDDEDLDDIYCKHCTACGEDGCCPPTMCKMEEDGLYCEHYLELLKENYRFMLYFAENYFGLYDKIYDEFNRIPLHTFECDCCKKELLLFEGESELKCSNCKTEYEVNSENHPELPENPTEYQLINRNKNGNHARNKKNPFSN